MWATNNKKECHSTRSLGIPITGQKNLYSQGSVTRTPPDITQITWWCFSLRMWCMWCSPRLCRRETNKTSQNFPCSWHFKAHLRSLSWDPASLQTGRLARTVVEPTADQVQQSSMLGSPAVCPGWVWKGSMGCKLQVGSVWVHQHLWLKYVKICSNSWLIWLLYQIVLVIAPPETTNDRKFTWTNPPLLEGQGLYCFLCQSQPTSSHYIPTAPWNIRQVPQITKMKWFPS